MTALDEAQAAVRRSDESPFEMELLMEACMTSTRYLLEHDGVDTHWFCDETLRSLGAKSIAALSFDRAVDQYLEHLEPVLSRCGNCARIYHVEFSLLKTQIRDTGMASDVVEPFIKRVGALDYDRLDRKMNELCEKLRQNPQATLIDVPDYVAPLYECLCFDVLVDGGSDLFNNFRFALLRLTSQSVSGNVLSLPDIRPGMLILFFGQDSELHKWAKSALNDIQSTRMDEVTLSTLHGIVQRAEERKSYNDSRLYWYNMCALVSKLDMEGLVEVCKSKDGQHTGLVNFVVNLLLLVPSSSLHSALRTLAVLLDKFGRDFWTLTTVNAKSIVASILNNTHLVERFADHGDAYGEYDLDYKLDCKDLVQWALSIVKACDSSSAINVGEQISRSLFNLVHRIPDDQKVQVRLVALQVLEFSFKFEINDNELPLIKPSDRIVRGDLKHMMCSSANAILSCLKTHELVKPALRVISLAVKFDVASGMPDSPLKRGEAPPSADVQAEITREYPTTLWESLNKKPLLFKKEMAQVILEACKYSVFIAHAPTKKHEEYWPKGLLSKQAIRNVSESLKNISDIDSPQLKVILRNRKVLTCLLLNMFSSDWDQNQATVDIVCQAYETDTVNRFDAILSLLKNDLRNAITSFCDAIDLVKKYEMFSPCSQMTKVLQDVSSCLFGAAGVLDNSKDQFSQQDNELVRFWNCSWGMLKVAFQLVYTTWSPVYKSDIMIEFMRDELDYCKTLLDAFRLVEADLSKVHGENFGEMLVAPAIKSIDSLCTLLRLKDESLIHSSYINILAIIELIKSFKVEFPETFINLLKRLATREISNVIPREKTANLLTVTGKFTNDEIDELVKKSIEKSTPTPTPTPQPQQQKPSSAPLSRTTTPVSGAAPPRKTGQRTLNDFMRLVPGPAPPPAPRPEPPSKSSMMDAIRESVKTQRNASTEASKNKQIREIHPARPAGFHSKRAQEIAARKQQKQTNGSSSEGSDDENELESLFTPKVPQARPAASVRLGAPTTSIAVGGARRVANTISQREREERNMRMRMNINLDPLYRNVLSWDYHHNSEYPTKNHTYKKVEGSFKSVEQYQKTFEPLLMLECWQNIVRAKEELNGAETPFKIVVGNRVTCDEFIDVYAMIESTVLNDIKLGDSDIVILTYYDSQEPVAKPADSRRPYCLAKIKEVKNASRDVVDIILRTYRPRKILPYLGSKYELHVQRVINMTTIEREFCSLKGLPYYDMATEIWKGQPTTPAPIEQSKIPEVQKIFQVNESQSKAIISSVSNPGFSLIQGPPGTGKTKTILGIVGAYLTGSPAAAPSIISAMETKPQDLKKVLICAPSNAAVDELVLRLKGGILGYHGEMFEPHVVRLGRSEAINSAVKELTLEDQVENAVAKLEQDNFDASPDGSLRKQVNEFVQKRKELRSKLATNEGTLEAIEVENIDMQIRDLNKKIKDTGHQMDLQREQSQIASRKREIERRRIQNEILQKSQIICATLSGSAHHVLSSMQMKFETVIIDEAAQCIELSALIPLKYGCKQCIMVGDPNQLPPTVLSQAAASLKYEQSLFVRMFNKFQENVHMLNTQFRMHPAISQFPSAEFYHSKLLDGPSMASLTARPWHSNPIFSPYRFFDVKGSHQRSKSKSLFNNDEAQIALELFRSLQNRFKVDSGKIGIISPYKSQVREIRRVFQRAYGDIIFKEVDFNTIDGFQGQEKDIIILSCVRAEKDSKGVGFLGDTRRMNVAVTRARSSLWILGNRENLVQNPVWQHLIENAQERGMYTEAARGFMSDRKVLENAVSGVTKKASLTTSSNVSFPTAAQPPAVSDVNAAQPSGARAAQEFPLKQPAPYNLPQSAEAKRMAEGPPVGKIKKRKKKSNTSSPAPNTPDLPRPTSSMEIRHPAAPQDSNKFPTISGNDMQLPKPSSSGTMGSNMNGFPVPTASGTYQDRPSVPADPTARISKKNHPPHNRKKKPTSIFIQNNRKNR